MEIHWPHFEMVRCATPKVRCIFRLCHWSCPCTPGVCYVDTLNTVFMLCLSYRRFAMSLCYVCCIHSYFSWEVASVMHPLFLIRPVSWSTHKHPYHHLYIYRISSFWMLMKNQWADIQSYQHSVPVKSWCFFNPKFHREIDPMISRREVLENWPSVKRFTMKTIHLLVCFTMNHD